MPELTDDILTSMLSAQAEMEAQMGYDFSRMSEEEKTAYIKEYAMHMEHEVHEMLQELPYFKPWKKYSDNSYDLKCMQKYACDEWADVLHHFLNITIALGMSADDLQTAYVSKLAVNKIRQQDKDSYKPCVGG